MLSGVAFEFLVTTPLVAQRPGETHQNSKLCPLIRNNGGYKLVGTGNKSAPYDSTQFSRWSYQQELPTLTTKQLWRTVSLVQFCAWQIRHGVESSGSTTDDIMSDNSDGDINIFPLRELSCPVKTRLSSSCGFLSCVVGVSNFFFFFSSSSDLCRQRCLLQPTLFVFVVPKKGLLL